MPVLPLLAAQTPEQPPNYPAVDLDQGEARPANRVNALARYGAKRLVLTASNLKGNLDMVAPIELGLESAVTYDSHFFKVLLDFWPALLNRPVKSASDQIDRTEFAVVGMSVLLALFDYPLVNDFDQLAIERQNEMELQPAATLIYPVIIYLERDHFELRRLTGGDCSCQFPFDCILNSNSPAPFLTFLLHARALLSPPI
jgi:hypothetical protein